jgi:DNA-binding response OmpR family regulator
METPSKPNVLFLEDDADTRELVTYTLEQSGINVLPAETIAEAWALADTQAIDLYLLDGLIPHGDSLELCRDLRTFAPTKPIVFYSGLAYKADIQKGIDAGATAYLVKPYSGDLAEEILQFIQKVPVLLNKANAPDTYEEESVRISEFPAAFDRRGDFQPSGRTQPENAVRLRNIRTVRTSGGII